jgi:D-alanine-D-alanine ligase
MKNIIILLPENNNSLSIISQKEPEVNPLPFLQGYTCKIIKLKKNEINNKLNQIDKNTIYLNLCDGSINDDRAGIEVVNFLEQYKLSFTGSNSLFYEPTRIEMKDAAKIHNINVPKYQYFNSLNDISNFSLNFPCIVKHPNSYSSIGLTKKSVVNDPLSLKKQLNNMIKNYKSALVEEYIDGKEFTVLVVSLDNKNVYAFDAAEIIFPEGETFKHFDLKWENHSLMKYVKVSDNNLNDYLKKCSIKIYNQMKGNGYARFDYRMDSIGNIYFLELNPNCSIYYPKNNPSSADEILNFYPNGHQTFTNYIINFAMQRFN